MQMKINTSIFPLPQSSVASSVILNHRDNSSSSPLVTISKAYIPLTKIKFNVIQ